MLTTRLVALTAACSLVSLPAAASPYSLNFDANPAYGPAGTHEVVVVESVPAAPAPPPAPAAVVVTAGPEVQPYADPSTTTVIVTAPPAQPAPPPAPVRPPPPPKRGLGLMIAGQSNKEIALDLDISPRTVEIFRAKVMQKMEADSLSALVRMGLLAAQA